MGFLLGFVRALREKQSSFTYARMHLRGDARKE
jgi:hypothetical protein